MHAVLRHQASQLLWSAGNMLQGMRRTWWAWPAMSWPRSSRCDPRLRRQVTWMGTCRLGLSTGMEAIMGAAAGPGGRMPKRSPGVKHVDRNVFVDCVSRPDLPVVRRGRASGR